jgi:HSP20 family protein
MLVKRKRSNGDFPAISNVLENFFGTDITNFFGSDIAVNTPAVNVRETNDSYRVEVAAPGLKKEDFKVNIENNTLIISSEKESRKEEEQERFTRKEFSYTSFQRSFTLPETTDPEKIEAKYENGILNIRIPKKEMAISKTPKKIDIK